MTRHDEMSRLVLLGYFIFYYAVDEVVDFIIYNFYAVVKVVVVVVPVAA